MSFLLLGREGQVGWELQRALAPIAPSASKGGLLALNRQQADLSQPEQLRQLIRQCKPRVLINAAAHTAVDQAEKEPELVHTINAEAVAVMAQEMAALGGWLVHYSSDYVFNGQGQTPWRESDVGPQALKPLGVYGRSKLAAEQAIAASGVAHLLFRTSWVYAARGQNFAKTMMRLALEKEQLQVVADQWGAPTGAELIADVTAHALRQVLSAPNSEQARAWSGIYHLAAQGVTHWHGYAVHVIECLRRTGVAVKVPPQGILAVNSDQFVTLAQRPLNSRLNCDLLQKTFALTLPPWQQGVERMLQETGLINRMP